MHTGDTESYRAAITF